MAVTVNNEPQYKPPLLNAIGNCTSISSFPVTVAEPFPPWPDYKPRDAHTITSVLCSDNAFFVCAYTTVPLPPSHNIGLLI